MNQTRRQNYFQAHKDVMQFLSQARAMRSALVKRLYCTDVCCEWVALEWHSTHEGKTVTDKETREKKAHRCVFTSGVCLGSETLEKHARRVWNCMYYCQCSRIRQK